MYIVGLGIVRWACNYHYGKGGVEEEEKINTRSHFLVWLNKLKHRSLFETIFHAELIGIREAIEKNLLIVGHCRNCHDNNVHCVHI